jgi:hypothetical protein
MKTKASRELFDYWNRQRGLRLAPSRTDIDPAAISGVLGDTLMITREAGVEPVFRLAGTRVCSLFGRELKSENFVSLWDARSHAELRSLLDQLLEDATGFVAGVTSQTDEGAPVALELLLLPLYRAGTTEARSIGVLSSHAQNGPVELQSVSGLTLTNWRVVGPRLEELMLPRHVDVPTSVTQRFGIVVHQGGRS